MNKFSYAILGSLLGVVVTGAVTYGVLQNDGLTTDGNQSPIFSYAVEETGDRAFGELGNANTTTEAYGRGGGGGGAPAMDAAMTARPQSGGGGGDAKMIAPVMTEYKLAFSGSLPALNDQMVSVLQRQQNTANADIGKILGAMNTGIVDLRSFAGAKTDMISFTEDKAFGYMVTINFRDGSISIGTNWEKWPHPESECMDEACYQRYRIQANEMLADNKLIGIANAFMVDHGINVSAFGDPEVDNQWRAGYETATDKAMYYMPDVQRVIYPHLVDGQPVYDEGGQKTGISVGVNVRHERVSDVWGLTDQKYLRSDYPAVTDGAAVTQYLNNFGKIQTGWMPPETALNTVEVTLGTPTMGFMKIYQYDVATPKELVVPALIFPVENVPSGEYFYRSAIAVPLARELLEKMNNQPQPMPMPLIMEDAVRTDDAASSDVAE